MYRDSPSGVAFLDLIRAQRDMSLEAMIWLPPGEAVTIGQGRVQGLDALLTAVLGPTLPEKLAAAKAKFEAKQ